MNALRKITIIVLALTIGSFAHAFSKKGDAIDHSIINDSILKEIHLNDWRTLDYDTIILKPNYMFVPLIFNQQKLESDTIKQLQLDKKYSLNVNTTWLSDALHAYNQSEAVRNHAIASNPALVLYNVNQLPEPPKVYVITSDPTKAALKIEDRQTKIGIETEKQEVKLHHWLHSFTGSLHFSQAYMSSNWYQGGNNNLNMLTDLQWTVSLNHNLHPKYLFSNTVRYRLGMNSAPNDSLRKYNINEDLLQINTNVGIKAINKWYYSMSLQFKTQIFKNYTSNTTNLKAAFLSPAELNIGVGLTYTTESKDKWKQFSLSLSPLAYDLKICKDIENLNPTNFGIEAGRHTHSFIGSTIEANFNCKFSTSVAWRSRFYLFSDYKNVQGDWENTLDFSINRYLSTQIFVHLRYDSATDATASKWKHLQLKEILSFGLTYKFNT